MVLGLSHVPRATIRRFFVMFAWLVLWSRHLVFHWRLLGNPDLLVVVRNSRVRDWLWLGKVLAPLAHPTWGKLLCDLMWFENLKYSLNSKVLINQLLNPRICVETCSYTFMENITWFYLSLRYLTIIKLNT